MSHPVNDLITDDSGASSACGRRVRPVTGRTTRCRSSSRRAPTTGTPDLVKELVGLGPEDFGSVAPDSIRGDGIKLARQVGGDVVRMPATAVPMLPGWKSAMGSGYAYGPDYAMPHCMIVGPHRSAVLRRLVLGGYRR